MREIIFRGKCIDNGEWIFGVPIFDWYSGGKTANIINVGLIECCDENMVIPETVGQYTGLKDKNGKMIFEGAILRFPAKDEYEKTTFVGYEVFYHDNDCADKHIGFQMDRMLFYGHLCGGECRAKLLPKYTSQMVIIGNIHDQKEDI